MRLLVSVRSAAEVAPAVAGGADIVDAKEPTLGSLGAVSGAVLREIAGRLPAGVPLSVALGDPKDARALVPAMAPVLGLEPRPAGAFIKVGLAAAGLEGEALLAAAVAAAAATALAPLVVAVAYADHVAAGAPAPAAVAGLAARAGAHGVLLDTWAKDGRDLFAHLPAAALSAWIEEARRGRLLVAIAGSLSIAGVRAAAALPADIVGVRGAACDGGRNGAVTERRVAQLKAAVA